MISVLPLFTVNLPLLVKPVPLDTIVSELVLLAIIVPSLMMGIGFESPMVPAPSMVLSLVKELPEPKMQLPEPRVTFPEPVRIVG